VSYRARVVGIVFIRKPRPDKVSSPQRNFHGLPEKPQALLVIFIVLVRIALHFIIVQSEASRSIRHVIQGRHISGVTTNKSFKESRDVNIIQGRRPPGSLENVIADFDLARTHPDISSENTNDQCQPANWFRIQVTISSD